MRLPSSQNQPVQINPLPSSEMGQKFNMWILSGEEPTKVLLGNSQLSAPLILASTGLDKLESLADSGGLSLDHSWNMRLVDLL